MSAVASAHAGVVNSAVETGEQTKAVPTRAFLNAINEYERMEGATNQHIAAEAEDSVEQPNDGDVANGEEWDLDSTDWEDVEGEFNDD
jgi:methionine-rich copper-binding protein CopC